VKNIVKLVGFNKICDAADTIIYPSGYTTSYGDRPINQLFNFILMDQLRDVLDAKTLNTFAFYLIQEKMDLTQFLLLHLVVRSARTGKCPAYDTALTLLKRYFHMTIDSNSEIHYLPTRTILESYYPNLITSLNNSSIPKNLPQILFEAVKSNINQFIRNETKGKSVLRSSKIATFFEATKEHLSDAYRDKHNILRTLQENIEPINDMNRLMLHVHNSIYDIDNIARKDNHPSKQRVQHALYDLMGIKPIEPLLRKRYDIPSVRERYRM
jgi:hypothetical protein